MADAKQGKSPIEEFCNGSSQSKVVLAKPRLGGFGSSSFASSSNKGTCNPFGSILRPPQLKPSSNPFLKVTESVLDDAETKDKPEEVINEDRLKDKESQEAEAPKFVPLGSANVTPRTSNVPTGVPPAPSSSAGFVFGQNLSARVELKESANNSEEVTSGHSSSNGSSELLFTSVAASAKEKQEDTNGNEATNTGEGLAAAAAEYERSHARPPPPTTNCTITGEEGEINVLQISCRLFAWEAGSWRERGRGVLRLNDAGSGGGARLVARVAGSLRVVLNTQLWPDMVVERAGTKSLRITAADAHQQVKLFLIMGSPGDIVQLHRALTARIAVSKRTTVTSSNTGSQNATSQKAAERLEADADENDYIEKTEDNVAEKQNTDVPEHGLDSNDRLETKSEHKTEEYESNVDGMEEDSHSLKRKEPADNETSPKRRCPKIVIE